MLNTFLLLVFILVSNSAYALNEDQFHTVTEKIESTYAPIIANAGGIFSIKAKWNDLSNFATAERSGKNWFVTIYGVIPRHPTMTEDSLALVICHEIGHLIGGAPTTNSVFNKPLSSEGQADYFASLKCMRRVFLNDDNEKIIAKMNVPSILSSSCSNSFPSSADKNICIRTGMAALAMAEYFAATKEIPAPKFETPDLTRVSSSVSRYASPQCRIDTYFQGALCEVSFNEDVNHKDEVTGTCHPTLGHKIGIRPACWFKPKK